MPSTVKPSPESTEPVFVSEGSEHWIVREKKKYLPWPEEKEKHFDIKPGEVPRRVLTGFVYGERVFLPTEHEKDAHDFMDAMVDHILEIDAEQREAERMQRLQHIPVEYERRLLDLAPTLGLRNAAAWLNEETGGDFTHGQVGRVVRRLRQQARLETLDQDLRADYQTARVEYQQAAELMLDLQLDFVEGLEHEDGETPLIQRLRTCQQTASLLQRELRTARRDFVILNRAAPPKTVAPAPAAPSSAPPSSGQPPMEQPPAGQALVEQPLVGQPPLVTSFAETAPVATATPRTTSPAIATYSRAWPFAIALAVWAVPAILRGWVASSASCLASAISSLAGLYAPFGAVLATSTPTGASRFATPSFDRARLPALTGDHARSSGKPSVKAHREVSASVHIPVVERGRTPTSNAFSSALSAVRLTFAPT